MRSVLRWRSGYGVECSRVTGALDCAGEGRGNTWERLEERVPGVPEHASSKAVTSASTPNLGGGALAMELECCRSSPLLGSPSPSA